MDLIVVFCILFVFMLVLYCFCVATEFSVNKDLYKMFGGGANVLIHGAAACRGCDRKRGPSGGGIPGDRDRSVSSLLAPRLSVCLWLRDVPQSAGRAVPPSTVVRSARLERGRRGRPRWMFGR